MKTLFENIEIHVTSSIIVSKKKREYRAAAYEKDYQLIAFASSTREGGAIASLFTQLREIAVIRAAECDDTSQKEI